MRSIISRATSALSSVSGSRSLRVSKHLARYLLCMTPLLVMSCQKNSHSTQNRSDKSVSYIGNWEAVGPQIFGSQIGDYKMNLELRSNNQCSAKVTFNTKKETAITIPSTHTVNLVGTWEITRQTLTTTFIVSDWNEAYPAGTPGGGPTGRQQDHKFEKYEIKTKWNIADEKFDNSGFSFAISDMKPDEEGDSWMKEFQLRLPFPKFTKKI